MKKVALIILLIIPALSIGIFWYQKNSHANLYEIIHHCKEAHMSCLTEKESIIEPAQELINDDLNEYLNLKTLKEKYLKADELMAKAFQTFLIIQGIRLSNSQQEWAYKNDQQRTEELSKEWENQEVSKDAPGSVPITVAALNSPSVETILPSSNASASKITNQAPNSPLSKPLSSFWNKHFRINSSNSTVVNHHKLLLLKGDFVGTFKDAFSKESAFFFQLNFPQKSRQDPETQVVIHMEGIESAPSANHLLYLEENFKVYQVTQSPMNDFYVLKNHSKNIEVHLNIITDKNQAIGKIYIPNRTTAESSSRNKTRKLGDFFIRLKK
ncbi:MAG: hypothetical protein A2202_02780 [Bdellovibrionales bacterium RIFOXYA1_FULL_36_14]|nr:MAG: hypothetical protein A2202_02780 [Bdellovibrionales bacterium RIFOXYA1_FULL_36_14]